MKLNHKKLQAFLKASSSQFEIHLVQEGVKSFLLDGNLNDNMKDFLNSYELFEEDEIQKQPNYLLELINLLGIQITNRPNFQINDQGVIYEPTVFDQSQSKPVQTGTMIFNSVQHLIDFLKSTLKTKWEVTAELTNTNIYLMQDSETGMVFKYVDETKIDSKVSVRIAIIQMNNNIDDNQLYVN